MIGASRLLPNQPCRVRREIVTLIRIEWEGPVSVKNAVRHNHDDIGLYQLYGRHPIFGRDSLLYIGKTTDAIASRIWEHMKSRAMEGFSPKRKWIKDAVGYFNEIYYGRLLGSIPVSHEEFEQQINDAESLLIYACSPPWNKRGIGGFSSAHKDLRILNFGSCGLLPAEVSTAFWIKEYEYGIQPLYQLLQNDDD